MYQRALQGKEKALGEEHASPLDTVNNLGLLYAAQGKLEEAETLLECAAPEDLATDGANLYLADGPRLLRLERNAATEIRAFHQPISALACIAGGALAVALGGREVRIYADPSATTPRWSLS